MKKFIRKPKKGDKPESDRKTYIIDAQGQVLGKIATCAVGLIRGKGRPDFAPHMEQGDNVELHWVTLEKLIETLESQRPSFSKTNTLIAVKELFGK